MNPYVSTKVQCPIALQNLILKAQFVYPFTLEPHIITLESSRRSTLAAHTARREAYLRSRDDEKERRKRDALHRIAPGFEPHGHLLVPTKGKTNQSNNGGDSSQSSQPLPPRSVMDQLVDQLAALEGTPAKEDP